MLITDGPLSMRVDRSDEKSDKSEMFSGFGIGVEIGAVGIAARDSTPVLRNEGSEGKHDDRDASRKCDEVEEEHLHL